MVSPSGGRARVRYLNEDLITFNDDATTTAGVFVIIGPSIAQGFVAELDGKAIVPQPNYAGSVPEIVLVMVMNIQPEALAQEPD